MAKRTAKRGTVEALLRAASKRARDLTPVMRVAIQDVKSAVAFAFRQSADPSTGKPWAALAESTQNSRRKGKTKKGKSQVYKPLVDTGVLKNSLAGKAVTKAGPRSLFVGTNVPYAGPHQFGGGPKKDRPPQRRFLPMNSAGKMYALPGSLGYQALKRIAQRVHNYIFRGDKKAI